MIYKEFFYCFAIEILKIAYRLVRKSQKDIFICLLKVFRRVCRRGENLKWVRPFLSLLTIIGVFKNTFKYWLKYFNNSCIIKLIGYKTFKWINIIFSDNINYKSRYRRFKASEFEKRKNLIRLKVVLKLKYTWKNYTKVK